MSRKDPSFTFADVSAPASSRGSETQDPTLPNLRTLSEHAFPDSPAAKAAAPEPSPRSRLAEMRRLSEHIKLQRHLEALKAKDNSSS
jgi:hypothetical protein